MASLLDIVRNSEYTSFVILWLTFTTSGLWRVLGGDTICRTWTMEGTSSGWAFKAAVRDCAQKQWYFGGEGYRFVFCSISSVEIDEWWLNCLWWLDATVIDDISTYREPQPSMDAMYLLMPTTKNIKRLISEYSDGKQQYKQAHLFFIDGMFCFRKDRLTYSIWNYKASSKAFLTCW